MLWNLQQWYLHGRWSCLELVVSITCESAPTPDSFLSVFLICFWYKYKYKYKCSVQPVSSSLRFLVMLIYVSHSYRPSEIWPGPSETFDIWKCRRCNVGHIEPISQLQLFAPIMWVILWFLVVQVHCTSKPERCLFSHNVFSPYSQAPELLFGTSTSALV